MIEKLFFYSYMTTLSNSSKENSKIPLKKKYLFSLKQVSLAITHFKLLLSALDSSHFCL